MAGPRGALGFWGDGATVAPGGVSPGLFVGKHGVWPALGALLLLLLLLLVAVRVLYGVGQWLVEPFGALRGRR